MDLVLLVLVVFSVVMDVLKCMQRNVQTQAEYIPVMQLHVKQ